MLRLWSVFCFIKLQIWLRWSIKCYIPHLNILVLTIRIYYIFWQTSAKNLLERWGRLVIWGFGRGQNNSVKICITEITENHYMKEEYPREQTEAVGDCHLDGHILLKFGGHLLQITGKWGYRLSCCVWESIEVVMSKTYSEDWAVRHRHKQNK